MNYKEQGSSRVITLASIIVVGAFILILFPTLVSGVWKLIAWVITGVSAISVGILHQAEKAKKELAAKELQRSRQKRSALRKQEKEKQEKRLERAREKLVRKEAALARKREQKKSEIIKHAETVWETRADEAKQKEILARKVIAKTGKMDIKTAAGQVAIEWNEATTLAQWTIQQIVMFSQRPNVTMQAREEAQDAIIESIMIKESGINWTKEHGEKLAATKEKARLEALMEEDRIDSIQAIIEDAEMKWSATQKRAKRWQDELDKIYNDKS